jgi:hypothetical protein
MVRRILGPKRDEVMRGIRNLYKCEFHNLYSTNIRAIKLRMCRACGMFGKRPLGRHITIFISIYV